MACDGLWDKLNYEDVINTVTRLRKESKTSTEIAKALVEEALNKVYMAVTIGEVQMRFISHADFTRDSSPHRTKSGLVWHERSPPSC